MQGTGVSNVQETGVLNMAAIQRTYTGKRRLSYFLRLVYTQKYCALINVAGSK